MPNYDLYTELELDKDMPPVEIGALLDGRINGLLGQGYQRNSPEVDQLATARAILSDPAKRNTYEAALDGPDGVIDVSWLHQLADSQPAAASDAPAATPSYDAASTSVINASGDSAPASSASSYSPEDASPAHAAGSDLSAGSSQSPYGQYSGYGQQGHPGQQSSQGQQSYGQSQFTPSAQSGQYGQQQFTSGNYGAPVPSAPAKAQFNTAQLSVAGRDRSQSKAYLACLGIMVVGMIYPLILLFTADDSDFGIFKGILFAIAHTAAWVGIAEIVWGVRRIVAPEEEKDAEIAAGQSSPSSDNAGA